MARGIGLILVVLVAACAQQRQVKLLFIGDSVTRDGGYVVALDHMLQEVAPKRFEVIPAGRNSETITGLTEEGHPGPRPYLFDRLDSLLEQHQPDIAFFYFGINCGIYQPYSQDTQERYRRGLERIVSACQSRAIHPVLITPPPLVRRIDSIEEQQPYSWKNPYPGYDQEVLEGFRQSVKAMTSKEVTVLDGTTALKTHTEQAYAKDPIHPTALGHELLAKSLFEQLTFLPL
ncbi:SGNH/GDSL hydrolase family protein [Marinoscillum furvescens]|uniref:Lysophospholipase L1-like esterase n=1 Tax=Marinoscillum furvescens DSM 4134 TaxID=1122208 RepID=A0A3D9KYY3_MARFU|nr:GDSL-type esterase/lipase family protein [Marinoscillum furvescens]RED95252.1 lysophospholipase L1-like esterase [Marinoscillum furvescens DSM 4134]